VRRRLKEAEDGYDKISGLQRVAAALNPRAFAQPAPPPKRNVVPEPATPLKVINDEDELMRAYQVTPSDAGSR